MSICWDDGSVTIDGGKVVIRLDLDDAEWLRDQLPVRDQFTGLLTAKIIEAQIALEPET